MYIEEGLHFQQGFAIIAMGGTCSAGITDFYCAGEKVGSGCSMGYNKPMQIVSNIVDDCYYKDGKIVLEIVGK